MTGTQPTPKRKLDNFELSRDARRALCRIKRQHGITKTAAVERGIRLLAAQLATPHSTLVFGPTRVGKSGFIQRGL
jgi:hypothetical protein